MSAYRRWTKRWWKEKWHTLTNLHRTAWYNAVLLKDWMPTIWRQRDFDQIYIYALLLVKFKRMRRRVERHRITADWDRQAKDYMICENLLKRLLADEYFDYTNYKSPETLKEWAKFRRETKHEDYMRKQDIDTLFRLMSRRIQTWWD